MQNIYIIGVGLIGGSLALDIKNKRPEVSVYGIDNSEDHLNQALELGVIDHKAVLEDLDKADLVVLAIPVDASVIVLPQVLDKISDFTLVADVGSTKSDICKVVENHKRRRNFLAMHPIAGTEFSGPKAAIRNLFNQKTNIICEVEKTAFKLQ
ncbi:MAG: prephenate dehydrogenase/arogenate dehydrogenase family protein, partial [Olleya sp.]